MLLVTLLPMLLAQPAPTPTSPSADTVTAHTHAAVSPIGDPTAPATVVFDLGAGAGTPTAARQFDFGVRETPEPVGDRPLAMSQVKLVRTPDSLSAELARRASTGVPIPAIDALLPGRGDAPAILVHLHDVRVLSARLVTSPDTLALAQQRIALEESIAQLGADLAEGKRQLHVSETLEKQRLSPSLELARLRGHVEALTKRLSAAEQRLALVHWQLARWAPVQEELTLSAARAEVEVLATR